MDKSAVWFVFSPSFNFDVVLFRRLLLLARLPGAWLTLIFATFGLFAPRNPVVTGALLVCAMPVWGAVLLILEMNSPFIGLITLSSAPMYEALLPLG